MEGVAVDKIRICDMLIHSGDIRDQSRKLSEITQNFGRIFRSRKF